MVIIAGIGLIIVVMAMALFGKLLWRAHCSTAWPITKGLVTASKIHVEMPGDEEGYLPSVQFEYTVAGKQYVGNQIRAMNWIRAWPQQASIIADRYPLGKQVPVRYHPKNPGISVLEPGFNAWELIAMLIFSLVAVALILVMTKRIDYTAW